MKKYTGLALLFLLLATPSASVSHAQEVFEDPDGQFSVSLPNGWLGIVSRDGLGRTDLYIVYKIRENGSLKLRRIDDADPNREVMEYASKDEAERVRFSPGYDKISFEKFILSPGKSGALLSYDFKTVSGQPFTGRIYYLRTSEKTIYILQFTGRKHILGTLRNQTDAIARSFKAK